jgi:NTP pyrophosphatase (non-canonical NTP hydrolase)
MCRDDLMNAPETKTLEQKVLDWAKVRGISNQSTPKDQFLKVTEELGEVAECLAKGKPLSELELEIGDLQVTVILLAALSGTSAERCLERAYHKIADRKGNVINGVFVKEGD